MKNDISIVKTVEGRTLELESEGMEGAQGLVVKGKDLDTHEEMAVKIFHPVNRTAENIVRTEYLCSLKLSESCPVLVAPLELINDNGIVGYIMTLVNGKPLLDFIEEAKTTFMQNLVCLITVMHGYVQLHSRKISHGDIRAGNVLVWMDGTVPRLRIIDFDNFSAPGIPKPTCLGDEMYLAPELSDALNAGKPVPPDLGSDLFSLRIMAEEILMLRHPTAGYKETEELFVQAMYDKWFFDPVSSIVPEAGYPPKILNARLANLFRRGMSRTPSKRPTAAEWLDALLVSLGEVYICPRDKCGWPCLADASKVVCPGCGKPFPTVSLVLPDGCRIPVVKGFMQIGRNELRAGGSVSTLHAIVRKTGPAVTIESHGRNGTYRRQDNGNWERLADGKPIVVLAGDVLRFADVEVHVE